MTWGRFLAYLAAAGLAWMLGIALGLAIMVPPIVNTLQDSAPACPSALGIFSTNMRVLIGCFLGLITGSTASLVTLIVNGIYVGISWNALTCHLSGWEVMALLAPHGLLEVPGMLLAGAAGMMGGAVARSIYLDGLGELQRYGRPLMFAIPVSVMLIFIAAFIESWSISRL